MRHIVNIGYPRSATSWLYLHLCDHLGLDAKTVAKEPNVLLDSPNIDHYKRYFNNQPISLNFQTNLYRIDRCLIGKLSQVATHVSIMLRDPWDLAKSMNSYYKYSNAYIKFADWLIDLRVLHFADVIIRWQHNLRNVPFSVLFFDDILQDPRKFVGDYLKWCAFEIDANPNVDYRKKQNVLKDVPLNLSYTQRQITSINEQIDRLANLVNRDLEHWKR